MTIFNLKSQLHLPEVSELMSEVTVRIIDDKRAMI